MSRMRRAARICIFGLLVLLAGGCWDRDEVENLAFVMVTAVDATSNQGAGIAEESRFKLTLFIADPAAAAQGGGALPTGSGGGGAQPGVWASGAGATPRQAIDDVQTTLPRRVYPAHNRAIVVSSEIASDRGMRPVLDYFDRSRLARRSVPLVIADGLPAEEVARTVFAMEPNLGEALSGLLRLNHQLQSVPLITLNDFLVHASLAGIDPIANRIVALDSGGEGDGETVKGPKLRYEGLALFQGDRLVGALNTAEARGLMWATGQALSATVQVPCRDESSQMLTFIVQRASGSVGIASTNPLRGSVDVRMEGRLGDVQCEAGFRRSSRDAIAINRRAEEIVRTSIRRALGKTQSLQVDPFGFGAALERAKPGLWKQLRDHWYDAVWPDLPVDINVRLDLRRTGTVDTPYQVQR